MCAPAIVLRYGPNPTAKIARTEGGLNVKHPASEEEQAELRRQVSLRKTRSKPSCVGKQAFGRQALGAVRHGQASRRGRQVRTARIGSASGEEACASKPPASKTTCVVGTEF
jgi:hypothetical protein